MVEKNSDVSEGVSKGNSGIVHAGYNEKIGTLKAKLNIEGNKMFDDLSRDLQFPFKRNGAFILAFSDKDMKTLESLKEKGEKLGIEGLEILTREEALNIEPNLNKEIVGVLNVKTSGIVSPYEMTIALAENAAENGVEFKLNSKVTSIEKISEGTVLPPLLRPRSHVPPGLHTVLSCTARLHARRNHLSGSPARREVTPDARRAGI